MIQVIGVRFKRAGKIYYFDPGDTNLSLGQSVVVETIRGMELGEVAVLPREVPDEEVIQPLKKVVRLATESDLVQTDDNKQVEQDAFAYAQERIAALALEMKLVEVELTFDKSKLVFYFTADKRIDFRELVKELVSKFRTRIELRQIGVRDEAKMLGGLGVCGHGLCCSTWIGDFAPVSIRHAKDQDLSMNPNKISGVCGRLKCCLRYESEAYEDARARGPKMGECILTPAGEARVVAVNLLRENCTLQVTDGPRFSLTWQEMKNNTPAASGGCCGRCHNEAVQSPDTLPTEPSKDILEESVPQEQKPPRKVRRPVPERLMPEPAADIPQVAQEIAAGSDEETRANKKRRRWRKRRPKGNNKEALNDNPA